MSVSEAALNRCRSVMDEMKIYRRRPIKVSDDLVAEIKSADHILIGTPMYNFSIPAILKAYIDQIVRSGVTV